MEDKFPILERVTWKVQRYIAHDRASGTGKKNRVLPGAHNNVYQFDCRKHNPSLVSGTSQ